MERKYIKCGFKYINDPEKLTLEDFTYIYLIDDEHVLHSVDDVIIIDNSDLNNFNFEPDDFYKEVSAYICKITDKLWEKVSKNKVLEHIYIL